MPPATAYRPQWEFSSESLSRVTLPNLIPCSSCQKHKKQNQYSNKQLNDLRYKVKRSGRGKIDAKNSVRCRECTGAQPQEMKCILCGNIKELRGFALAQRKTPDCARCLVCMQAQELVLPENSVYETGSRGPIENFDDEDEDEDEYDLVPTRRGKGIWEMDASGQYLVSGDDSSSSVSNPYALDYESTKESSKASSKAPSKASSKQGAVASSSKKDGASAVAGNRAGSMLTSGNLLNLNHVNKFAQMSLMEMEKEDDDSSSSGETERTATIRGNLDLPKNVLNRAQSVKSEARTDSEWGSASSVAAMDSSDEEDEEEDRRPAPILRRQAHTTYTAVDAHGNRHQIDAVSVSTHDHTTEETESVVTRSSVASTKSYKTVGSGFKYTYGAFRKPEDERNARKFARVRPENMDPTRAKHNLLTKDLVGSKEAKTQPGRMRDDPGSDEEW